MTTRAAAEAQVKAALPFGINEVGKVMQLIQAQKIKDYLVGPKDMLFGTADSKHIWLINAAFNVPIHTHALRQMATKVELPLHFVTKLIGGESWKRELLAHNLFQLFYNWPFEEGQKFLFRIAEGDGSTGQLRGFLSRRFNRWLGSAPLSQAFITEAKAQGAVPVAGYATGVKFVLRFYLPQVFEPIAGEFLCIGVEWSNSDFGQGQTEVAMSVWHPTSGRSNKIAHGMTRRHIGSVIQETDLDVSEEAAKADVEAQQAAVRDAVAKNLSTETVEKLLDAIVSASTREVHWSSVKGMITRHLGKKASDELEKNLHEGRIVDLPPLTSEQEDVTEWWASQLLSWLADREVDPDKKLKLEESAGKYLEV